VGLGQTISSSSGNTHLFSVYVKGEGSNIGKQINFRVKRSSGGAYIGFDKSITLTSEWQRVKLNPLTLITDNNGARIIVSSNDAINCLIAFSQAEQGSYPTSYIPSNSGSQTTRTADVCNNAGTAATFNDSEGVLFAEIAALDNDLTTRIIAISDGSTANTVRINYHTVSNRIRALIKAGGVTQTSFIYTFSDITDFNKIALSYKENDVKLYADGVLVSTDSSASMPSGLSELAFNDSGGNNFYGKTKQLMVFDEALSDEELSDLTGQVNLSFNNLATFYNYTIL